MAYLLAVAAALANALSAIFQRIGVQNAPADTVMSIRLIRHAFSNAIWFAGLGMVALGFVFQAVALRFGQLSVVQPVLTTELLFLLLILAVWFRYRLGAREWLGALLVVGGLGGFFLAAHPHGGQVLPSTAGWLVASAILIGAIAGSAIPLGLAFGHLWQIPVLAGALIWLFIARRGVVSGLLVAGLVGVIVAVAGVPV